MPKTEELLTRYAKTIMTMCYDFIKGGITAETFASNLRLYAEAIEERIEQNG